MAKTTAPLLSFGGSGQIGKTMVYGSWKGRSYVRRHVTPANPQSAEQTITRNAFSFLQSVYKYAPALVTDVWTAYATGLVMTARNGFTKFNLPVLRGEPDLANMVLSGGANGGPPPTNAVVTPGNNQLSVAVTAPTTVPTGWTLTSAVVAAIEDQDPDSGTLFTITAGEDTTDPYTVVLTGLNEQLYQVRAWLKWARPDGSVAYSPDFATTGTPT